MVRSVGGSASQSSEQGAVGGEVPFGVCSPSRDGGGTEHATPPPAKRGFPSVKKSCRLYFAAISGVCLFPADAPLVFAFKNYIRKKIGKALRTGKCAGTEVDT